MMATETERVLVNPKQLKEYLKTLPPELELRFPSITSFKGDRAAIMIIYDKKTHCILLGAYDTTLAGLSKDTVKIEGEDGSNITVNQDESSLLLYGITKETGLIALTIKWLGFPKRVKNTNTAIDAEFHHRHYGLVDEFKGYVKAPDPILNPKIKEYVWVKDFLLYMIFDQLREVSGVPIKPHPQKEGYKRFTANKTSRKITLKEMLKGKIFKNHTR